MELLSMFVGAMVALICVIIGFAMGSSQRRSKDSQPPSDPPEGRPKVDQVFKP